MQEPRILRQGRAIRLKAAEGTFSYYHPQKLFTGFGWDAQTASLLFLKRPLRSLLILGLGGGTVARQCRELFPEAEIVGVEINERVLELAYDFFRIGTLRIETLVMSGQAYLQETCRRFDAVLDDMWPIEPESSKPLLKDPCWIHLISTRLNSGGMYAANLYNRRTNRIETPLALKRLKSAFACVREIVPKFGQTTVVAAGSELAIPEEVRIRVGRMAPPAATKLREIRFLAR